MKIRQDAWSHDDDLLLAETVLRHIREGSTQLNAFEEVGDKLNRTGAACGFRWNAVVRNHYLDAIEIAKKQRKQLKRKLNDNNKETYYSEPESKSTDFESEFSEIFNAINTRNSATDKTETNQRNNSTNELSLDSVIKFLKELKTSNKEDSHFKNEHKALKQKYIDLKEQHDKVLYELTNLKKNYESVQGDYQSLVQIMDRARKMILFGNEEDSNSQFKMDKNGNLERMVN